MEENSQRALAYALAKPIDNHALDQISGGVSGAGMHLSTRETVVASGFNSHNADVMIDGSLDW